MIHGPNITGSYAIYIYIFFSFFTASDFTFITSHIQNWVLFLLWLHLFIFLELSPLFPVAYWTPTDLGGSSFSVISFCLFIPFLGFSRQECWSGLSFLYPEIHILSELSTMTLLSWVAPHGMAHSSIQLDKAVVHVIRLVIKPKDWEVMVFNKQCDPNYVINQQL